MKRILYLGLEPPQKRADVVYIHYPVIRTLSRSDIWENLSNWDQYSHLILTSKTAARILLDCGCSFAGKKVIAVGKATATVLPCDSIVADEATAEGVVKKIESLDLKDPFFFWPHSALSRPLISNYLREKHFRYTSAVFYDTLPVIPDKLPDLSQFDEILFTSPSTVDAFFQLVESLPSNVELTSIGPVTENHLKTVLSFLPFCHNQTIKQEIFP